jgi:hypothetical protein
VSGFFHFLYIRCSAIFGVCFATTFFDLIGPLPSRQAFGLLCQKFPTHPPETVRFSANPTSSVCVSQRPVSEEGRAILVGHWVIVVPSRSPARSVLVACMSLRHRGVPVLPVPRLLAWQVVNIVLAAHALISCVLSLFFFFKFCLGQRQQCLGAHTPTRAASLGGTAEHQVL